MLLATEEPGGVETLVSLLGPYFDIVGTLNEFKAVIAAAKGLNPDIVVLDIAEPSLERVEIARELKREAPGAKLIFVVAFITSVFLGGAFCAGAQGCVLRSRVNSELPDAIREALEGRTYVSANMIDVPLSALRLAKPLDKLTARERDVLRLTTKGKTAKEIAAAMDISPRTVAFHKANIMEKLGAHTTAELAAIAAQCGIDD